MEILQLYFMIQLKLGRQSVDLIDFDTLINY